MKSGSCALSVGAPDSLGRHSVKFHKGATHSFRIVEPYGSRDFFNRLGPVLQAHTGRFGPKPLDSPGRGSLDEKQARQKSRDN
jgi:hypothetical protein